MVPSLSHDRPFTLPEPRPHVSPPSNGERHFLVDRVERNYDAGRPQPLHSIALDDLVGPAITGPCVSIDPSLVLSPFVASAVQTGTLCGARAGRIADRPYFGLENGRR